MIDFTTVPASNDKGNWAAAKFDLGPLVSDKDLFVMASEFHKSVTSGATKADYAKSVDAGDASVSGSAQAAENF
jgi:hypothetical protein